jgi:hypothetical protein
MIQKHRQSAIKLTQAVFFWIWACSASPRNCKHIALAKSDYEIRRFEVIAIEDFGDFYLRGVERTVSLAAFRLMTPVLFTSVARPTFYVTHPRMFGQWGEKTRSAIIV